MLHPSTKRLIDKLSEMTRRQKVAWQEAENGQVTHDTEGYRVTLTPEPHAVLLTDALGREIESCGPDEYTDDLDADGRPYAMFVGELYREARRHARGAEKAISALLAGLDQTEAAPEPVAEPEAEAEITTAEDLVEDPGDDSAPLEAEDYADSEGESEITSAVASMAEQVNGQHKVDFVEEEEVAEAGEETAETGEAPSLLAETPDAEAAGETPDSEDTDEFTSAAELPEEDLAEEIEPEEAAEPEIASTAEEPGPSIAQPEHPEGSGIQEEEAELEQVSADSADETAEDVPDNTEAATAPVEEAADFSDMAAHAAVADTYAPAFAEASPDATAYVQSEPVGSFEPEQFAGASAPDMPLPEIEPEETEQLDVAPEADAEEEIAEASWEPEPAESIAETTPPPADEPTIAETPPPAEPPRPAAPGFGGGGFFGGGFGSSLARYKTDAAPSEPAEPEATAAPAQEATAEVEAEAAAPVTSSISEPAGGDTAEEAPAETFSDPVDLATDDIPEPDIETESQPEPAQEPEMLRSFSLSGITSGFGLGSPGRASAAVPEAEAEPLYTDTVEIMPEHTVIDGTTDLPDWASDTSEPDIEIAAPEQETWTPPSPEPEVTDTHAETEAAEAPEPEPEPEPETVSESAEADAAPAKPARRFNPWS